MYGTASIGTHTNVALSDKGKIQELLDTVKAHGVNQLDTARVYV